MGVFNKHCSWEVPIERISKSLWGKLIWEVSDSPSLWGVLGAWMTFKKSEMAKTLGLSMSETDPLNHKWLDFAI